MITEKAKEYAKGKAMDALTSVIEQAYVDGYNAGLSHLKTEELEAAKERVKYVPIKLGDGIIWSVGYMKNKDTGIEKLPYVEAEKLDIPTKEDVEKLISACRIDYDSETSLHGLKFTYQNGERLRIPYGTYVEQNDEGRQEVIFWVRDNEACKEKTIAQITKDKCKFSKVFMGYRLPVVLLKKNCHE